MFKTVAILGTGLIGSSLSRALLTHKLAVEVVGYDAQASVAEEAMKLGAITRVATTVTEAVQSAEIAVICTPLGAYAAIAKEFASAKATAVLTDVGSVKMLPTQQVMEHLLPEQRAKCIPGHPIAGTERSGPAAGFDTLFAQKIVLLSPQKETDAKALHQVEQMWQSVGAKVMHLDAEAHDQVYARVSHVVQWIASVYGIMVMDQWDHYGDDISTGADETFRSFTRLTGSNSHMWSDIFTMNSKCLSGTIAELHQQLKMLDRWISRRDVEDLQAYFSVAEEKRRTLHQARFGETFSLKGSSHVIRSDADILGRVLPICLASSLMHVVNPTLYEYAFGAGFLSVTEPALYASRVDVDALLLRADQAQDQIRKYMNKSCQLSDNIQNKSAFVEMLESAVPVYKLTRAS